MIEKYINTVLHGDSADILYELPRKSVDLVVTSPPYSDLRKYGGVGDTWNERKFREIAVGLSDVLKDGGDVCSKAKQGKCNISFVDKIELNCPHDCPHRDEYKWKKCKQGKCEYVKKKIKEIEL